MIALHLMDGAPAVTPPVAAFDEWLLPSGEAAARFYRVDAGYLVRFPNVADFEISSDASAIVCRPAVTVADDAWSDAYWNQVLPLALSRRGKLVFHASCVEIGDCAVAFVGPSGRGKSTLAASFAAAGGRFLGDDGLLVEEIAGRYLAMPSHPSIRLWGDSEHMLLPGGRNSPPKGKRRVAAGELRHCGEAKRLACAYFLGEGTAGATSIDPMDPADAHLAWVRNSFLLDPGDAHLLSRHFERVANLANAVQCHALDFPRRFDAMGAVRNAIREHVTRIHEAF